MGLRAYGCMDAGTKKTLGCPRLLQHGMPFYEDPTRHIEGRNLQAWFRLVFVALLVLSTYAFFFCFFCWGGG